MNKIVFPLLILVACVCSSSAQGQNDRRGRSEPGLLVETGARMGICDMLTFTADGRHLLAVGDDKVVRTWAFDGKSLGTETPLRWSIWRERRGAIYALALSPDPQQRYVVIGGFGVRTGSLCVLDRTNGDVVHALTKPPADFKAIWSVAFSPTGKEVAFGTHTGEIWLWKLASGKQNDLHRVGRYRGGSNSIRLVAFTGPNHLLTVAEDGPAVRWDLGVREADPVSLFDWNVKMRHKVVLSADGKWLAAAGQLHPNNLEVRSLEGGEPIRIDLPVEDFPQSIALDAHGRRLAVGIRTIDRSLGFERDVGARIDLYDLTRAPPLDRRGGSRGPRINNYAEAMTFHPDGSVLAVAGGNDYEITVWDVGTAPANLLSEVRGPGSGIWGVGLSRDGWRLGYRTRRKEKPDDVNDRAAGPWTVFDLKRRAWVSASDFEPLPPVRHPSWTVVPDPKDARVWRVQDPDGRLHPLVLDVTDDKPTCYTFLPDREGQRVRLAVGHYWGFSVFELDQTGAHRVRVCYGQNGPVTALAPSANGALLVTASRDETIAAWSLADWTSQAQLGARFKVRLTRLFVDEVDPGSPAWEAGLLKGDEVLQFALAGNQFLFDADGRLSAAEREHRKIQKVAKDAGDCLSVLQSGRAGKEHYFLLRREGEKDPIEIATYVRQRPLWRFFPTRTGEWVLWRTLDYYYDASPAGDSLIGWQVGADVDQKPAYYPARQFDGQGRFYSPARITEVLKKASYTPEKVNIPDLEPPALDIQVDKKEVTDQPLVVSLSATPRGNRDFHQPERLILWIGDYRFRDLPVPAPGSGGTYRQKLTIPATALRHGQNRLTLQCYNRAGTSEKTQILVTRRGPAPRPRLFALHVGVADYSRTKQAAAGGKRLVFGDLMGVRTDIVELDLLWKGQKDKGLYENVFIDALRDEKATAPAVLGKLAALATTVRPDDLLVLYLGGHGYTENQKGTFIFVGPSFDLARPTKTGLLMDDLYRGLTDIPGRKLVLLMACHSGEATAETVHGDPVRALTPGGVGPAILSACQAQESALVDDTDGSLFVQAIVEAGQNHARLDVQQLGSYVEKRVPQMLKAILEADRKEPDPKNRRLAGSGEGDLSQVPCFLLPGDEILARFPLTRR